MKSYALILLAVFILFAVEQQAAADDFFDAYQKEYAFLEAEKSALKQRISDVGNESAQKEATAQKELALLQGQLLALHNRADSIELDLDETERDNSDMVERQDMLKETLTRAKETLEQYGFDVAAPSENTEVQATQIVNLFRLVEQAYDKGSRVELQKGDFFLLNGKKVSGDILTIGQIAAFGTSTEGGGALAPAGGGRYKVWDNSTAPIASAMVKGEMPNEIPLFLYESMEKPVEQKEEKSWKQIVDSGGIIAWIIVGLGAVALLMIIARVLILLIAGTQTDKLIGTVGELVKNGDLKQALARCNKARGAAAHVLKVTIENIHKEKEKLDDIVSEAILNKAPLVDRFNTSIMVAASVAPLLGLLGTVTGMISTFDIITEHGTGDPKMLSGGISEALVTTELGLIVAIPALLFGTLLSGRASAIMDAMERAALQIINIESVKNKSPQESDIGSHTSGPSKGDTDRAEKAIEDKAAQTYSSGSPAEAAV